MAASTKDDAQDQLNKFVKAAASWSTPEKQENWFDTLKLPESATCFGPKCLPCLRAISQGLAVNGGEATADDEFADGGVNCEGPGCMFCEQGNERGRDPSHCVIPSEGTKVYMISRALSWCQGVLMLFLGELDIDDEEEGYKKVCEWNNLLIDWIKAHAEDLIVETIE